ncbi:uncharacterized protein LOC123715348 isoform X2 [Pieris brassicae]|uniref:uncharacterized protein LOC123715348 isoform X2 n=1 Tax=Pieris brassicae TaxID=7116 RepID=UPI001E65E4F8|nr:uncharacterized protein LOC123715348 isoform X2 [Pieris brassicae]
MMTKSIVFIVLVTFANFVSPRARRHYRQRFQQAPRYMPGLQPLYPDQTTHLCPCESKQSYVTPYTTFSIETQENIDGRLILPPPGIQLPFGLGYSSAAIPAVAEAYNVRMLDNNIEAQVSEALIPVSPEFACIKIATPFCSDQGYPVRSIVL